VGNEVDGHWQIGYKTPQEYARVFTEYGKVMKWVDPDIKLVASAVSDWEGEWEERTRLILEQAGNLVDYLSLHWYIGNRDNDFTKYMAVSELLEKRLKAFEDIVKAAHLQKNHKRNIYLAVDEWNVWYRTFGDEAYKTRLEEIYNLEDALAIGIQLNAFIRHAGTVKMANLAQIVNVIAPVFTNPDGLVLQTIFYPFELYSRTCGNSALDVSWEGDTFSGGGINGIRTLDVTATFDEEKKQVVVYMVNRSLKAAEAQITMASGGFSGEATVYTVNGPDIKATNTFTAPQQVTTKETARKASGDTLDIILEPHSVTALIYGIS
jgi:alpha-N-arabinofuranosidase